MIRDQPTDAARALATDLDAELAIGGEATERAMARLRRRDPPPAPVDVPAPAPASHDFEQLGQAMRRAEAIRDRTRARVADQLSRTINTALAIHPDTLRRAAAELLEAGDLLERARAGRPPPSARLARRLRGGGTGAIAAAGVAIGAVSALPVGAAVAAVGLAGGGVTWQAERRAARRTIPLLEAGEAVARRRWEQLAGPGSDPRAVEAVIRLYDPQHRVITDLLAHNPAVRAADLAAAHHRTAWVEAWRAEVGDHQEPEPAAAATQPPSPPPAPRPPPLPRRHRATLVVASPYAELSEERARTLHRRLLALPPGIRVIVVLGPETVTDERPVLDLRDDTVGLPTPEPAVAPVDPEAAPIRQAPLHHLL